MRNNRKLLSLLLALTMLFTLLPAPVAVAADVDSITDEFGAAVVDAYVPDQEVPDLYSNPILYAPDGGESYQWQLALPNGLWVSISGDNAPAITLTYAKLASVLDENGAVQLRCLVDGEATEAVTAWCYGTDVAFLESDAAEDDAPFFTLLSDMLVEVHSYIEPIFALPVPGVAELTGEADEPTEGDVKATHLITINYQFEDDEIVSDPYTAELAEGSSFSATVTFPTVQGYLPYVDDVQQNSIELNYTSVSADVTINVIYKPTSVNYTVRHYQQNVDNDEYVLLTTETKSGLTGAQVPEVHKEYKGFYHLIYERPEIAADGSTVIEVCYDRYYYLMNFDMDGGYGTDPVYARYGAPIGEVAAPTKAGYTFKGWSETEGGTTAVTLPTTMPDESKTYYAIWQVTDTAKVTIVFWGENADDENYSYLSDYTKEINLKPGTEFTYSENGMLTCDKSTHAHTDECYEFICTTEAHEHNNDCYTCGNAEHKHGVGCYEGASNEIPNGISAPWNAPGNPENGQVLTESHFAVTRMYIYINGNWYTYTGSVSSGNVVAPNCGMTEHTHTTACIGCGKTEHEHTRANCYKLTCTEEEHAHTSSCYEQGAGLDSTLWKFVKSDTVTVAADGSTVVNVYYDRVEYCVQFYENQSCSSNREYTSLKITAKWGQNILDKWPTENGSSSWYVKDKSDTWQNSIQVMPVGGAKFWGPKSGSSTYTATYYVEILDGEKYAVKGTDGRFYKVHHTDTSNSSGDVTDEERYGIAGFTINNSISTANGSDYGGSVFYYTRNSYKLTFNDQYNDVKNETVKFEAPLSTYKDYVPAAPSAYEPGSVEFGGWYLNPQCTGEQYDLTGHTMPAHDIILYAKWVPVNRTVKFYLTESSTEVYKPATATTEASFTIPHGDNIAEEYVKNHLEKSAMNDAKPNGDYTFVMWYYYEDGVKTPFDPTMQIRKDLTLYGEWSSNTLKEYTVQFVLKDDHSVKVAADITGSGLAGNTVTFDAKGGTDLYAAYQEGYFPTVQSQSLLLDIEAKTLTITFEYVPMPAVPYTVKYVDKDTGDSLAADKVVSDNRKAVVTENFKAISGYMPDAYQKRLVVTADGNNVIIFYYTKDTEHAYYTVTHYTQRGDGNQYDQYGASSQIVGDIGTRYTAAYLTTLTNNGWKEARIEYVVNGAVVTDITAEGAELTANGLEIKLYYDHTPYVLDFGLSVGVGGKTFTPGASFLTAGTTSQNYVALSGTGYLFYPASNVLYEENFFSTKNGSKWNHNATELPGAAQEANNTTLYGYDGAYKSTTGELGVWKAENLSVEGMTGALTTSFYGNGFDLIGTCAPTTGRVFLVLKGTNTTKLVDIDTRYSAGKLYQVPLAHIDLEEGLWEVSVYAAGLAADAADEIAEQLLEGVDEVVTLAVEDNSDLTATRGAVVEPTSKIAHQAGTWVEIDAFRVYRPADLEVYPTAEKNATYRNVIDALGDTVVTAYVDDETVTTSASTYESMGGPQNEVYLKNGQAIAFKLTGAASIDISVRAVGEASGSYTSNTEMYYSFTPDENGVVTIKNDNENMIAVGNLKLPADAKVTGYNETNAQVLLASVRMAFTSAKPFDPAVFDVHSVVTPLLRKKLVTVAVTVSDDVHHVTVNGETYYPNAMLLKWFGKSTITVTMPAVSGDSFEIVAYSASGARSTAKTVNVK